jgi:hypothetical protein
VRIPRDHRFPDLGSFFQLALLLQGDGL